MDEWIEQTWSRLKNPSYSRLNHFQKLWLCWETASYLRSRVSDVLLWGRSVGHQLISPSCYSACVWSLTPQLPLWHSSLNHLSLALDGWMDVPFGSCALTLSKECSLASHPPAASVTLIFKSLITSTTFANLDLVRLVGWQSADVSPYSACLFS